MEKIELVVTHHSGAPADRVVSAIFGMAGGTIGRSGQNKLVLPDTDAQVARVHAMVRLDSDHAYLANLCERRSVQVDGLDVVSGQEVPLGHGAEIVIGAYRILATVPGAEHRTAASSLEAHDGQLHHGVGTSPQSLKVAPESLQGSPHALGLASLPNPWADIPPIVGGEFTIPELVDGQTATARADGDSVVSAGDDPFAMLGRMESLGSNAPAATAAASIPPACGRSLDEGSALVPSNPEPASACNPLAPAATGPAPAAHHKPQVHRAMVIPDDFDPFAADPKDLANQRDAWSGDLAAKSLSEVAQLKNDELLQSLPPAAHFAGHMDNPAHTGLPKQLDPHVELNPLKLFREPGESMYREAEDHGLARGSDLAQVFSMPRGTWRDTDPIAGTPPAEHAVPSGGHSTMPHAIPEEHRAAEVAQAAGLQTMQGLDLDLFGAPALDAAATDPSGGLAQSDPGELPVLLGSQAPRFAPRVPSSEPTPGHLTANESTSTVTTPEGSETLQTLLQPALRTQPHPAPVNDGQALAAAFLEGAGLALDRAPFAITPEFMRQFGEVLRVAVQGSIDLLSARSEIKKEFRADVTIIASGKNNPLKFLPTAEGVMLQLVGQSFPGFMPPVAALQEAFNDLAVHQIALMAGIRAAYAEAVTSLSPAELEKKSASSGGMLTRLSSLHRKAALWDEYQQKYDSIRQHAEDDLMAFSGQTFVQAYENAARSAGGTP